ncbi:MAG: hypothetical protein ACYDCN_14800 [Bacteroidia bacterium]
MVSSIISDKIHVKCGFYLSGKKEEYQYEVKIIFKNLKVVSISKKNKKELTKENSENKKMLNDIPPPPPR